MASIFEFTGKWNRSRLNKAALAVGGMAVLLAMLGVASAGEIEM